MSSIVDSKADGTAILLDLLSKCSLLTSPNTRGTKMLSRISNEQIKLSEIKKVNIGIADIYCIWSDTNSKAHLFPLQFDAGEVRAGDCENSTL